jgi:hypothetical protein
MEFFADKLENAVVEVTSICQQSTTKIAEMFDDLKTKQHRTYIPYTINRYRDDIYEQPFDKNSIVTEYMNDNDSSTFKETRKLLMYDINNLYIDMSKAICNYIHDNPSGAYNSSISKHFGFTKFNFDKDGNKFHNIDYISHNFLNMLCNRDILGNLEKREGKVFYKVISSHEFTPIELHDVDRKFCSKLEAAIAYKLEKADIIFIPQYRFSECRDKKPLPFDFYLPEYNILIEVQGQQHYEPIKLFGGQDEFAKRLRHDFIKNKFSKLSGIYLLKIRYDEVDKIKDIKTYIHSKYLNDL